MKQSLSILFGITLLMVSCKKGKQTEESAEIAQQNSIAEATGNEMQTMGDEASKGPNSFTSYGANCLTLTYDTTNNVTTITLDYGTTNCLCEDGRNRRGILTISYTGQYNAVGTVVTTTPTDYYVNDNKIEGTRTATNVSDLTFSVESDLTITLANDGGIMTWNSSRTREQIAGEDTPFNLFDNVYSISGMAGGQTAQGKDYSIETTTNLEVQLGCRYIKSGVLTISSSFLDQEATIDYGDGTCDNKALLKYGNKEKEITL